MARDRHEIFEIVGSKVRIVGYITDKNSKDDEGLSDRIAWWTTRLRWINGDETYAFYDIVVD